MKLELSNIQTLASGNKHFKNLRKVLNDKDYRQTTGLTAVEGISLLNDILKLAVNPTINFTNRSGSTAPTIREIYLDINEPAILTKFNGILDSTGFSEDSLENIYGLTSKQMASVSALKSSPGLMALVKVPGVGDLDNFDINQNILILDQINDPSNMGPIIRSAAAFGFDQILLTKNCCEPFSPRVIRSSAGMVLAVSILYSGGLIQALEDVKKKGYQVVGTYVDGGKPLETTEFRRTVSVVFGSEAHGIDDSFRGYFDDTVTVGMAGHVESLNLSVSAGIILRDICLKQGRLFEI